MLGQQSLIIVGKLEETKRYPGAWGVPKFVEANDAYLDDAGLAAAVVVPCWSNG
jgi:hypothetical protein